MVGEAVNLASPRELSEALYTKLRLQPPPKCFGRWSPTSADCPRLAFELRFMPRDVAAMYLARLQTASQVLERPRRRT